MTNMGMLCIIWYLRVFPDKDMGISEQGDGQKGGRSRRFGGEEHGRKLTKDAINVFSQATNSRRTKSWLGVELVWHRTARNSRYSTSGNLTISTTSKESCRYIPSQDYGQSPAEAKKTGPWQIGDWASGRG
jgi:hypothetical protein